MIKKIIIILFLCFGIRPPFAFAEASLNDRFILEFIGKYGDSIELCRDYAKNRDAPQIKYIDEISKLSRESLRGFLIYKHTIAINKCTEQRSGYPIIFLLLAAGGDTSPQMREALNMLLKILPSQSEMGAFYIYKSIPTQQRERLDDIKYFDEPFDIVKIFHLVKDRKKLMHDGDSKSDGN